MVYVLCYDLFVGVTLVRLLHFCYVWQDTGHIVCWIGAAVQRHWLSLWCYTFCAHSRNYGAAVVGNYPCPCAHTWHIYVSFV